MRLMSASLCAASLALWAGGPAPADAATPVIIEGADESQRKAILELLPDRDPPESLFDAERLAEEAAARARAWLRAEGYYGAEITPDAQEDPPAARLLIAPGRRFKFAPAKLSFDGDLPEPAALAAAQSALAPVVAGAPARAADVLAAEAAATAALAAHGYADVKPAPRRVVVDHATGEVAAELRLAPGQRVRLAGLRAEPPGVFRESFLERLRAWPPGAVYAPERLAELRRDLIATGAVTRASTRLESAGEGGLRDVVLEFEPARKNAYEVGLGWSNTEGLGAEAEWTRRNLTGRADNLTIAMTLGELLQSARAELERPHAAGLNRTRRYAAEIAREDSEAYTRSGLALSMSVEAARRLRFATTYGVALSADRYEAAGGVSNAIVASGFGEVRADTTDHPLDPREGHIATLRLEPSISTGDATLGFVRAIGEGRHYQSFGEGRGYTLAARARAGWVEPVAGSADDIPLDRRFYAGGGGSVRGYDYNSIFPEQRRVQEDVTPGGQGLVEVSAEARLRLGQRWGAAVFIDGGNAFDDWKDAADLRWGAGFGVRYNLGFAPLRVDIATPLDKREGDPGFALYISLGQAF